MSEYLNWLTDEQQRWLQELHPEGILELDDGSLWKIDERSAPTAASWVRFSSIRVQGEITGTGVHCYSLLNTSYGQLVRATYVGNAAENHSQGVA